jgi:peptidoglycan/xylan/chitin deacetylase (PgdA/CDA1 family)
MWKERHPKQPVSWPNGVRLPILISVHHQSEEATCAFPDGQPDPFDVSERQYGGRRGAWRLLEVLDRHGIKGTWLICGATMEKYPAVSRAVKKAGHAIAGHTYAHEMICNLPAHVELELIKKTVSVFEDILGERLRGWRTCYASHNTLDLLLEHTDFAWDGSMWNDDLPYVIEGDGRQILEMPFATYSDAALAVSISSSASPVTPFSTYHSNTPEFIFNGWKAAFEGLYEMAANKPAMMPLVVHDFTAGRPSRVKTLNDFISYVKSFEGVVFTHHEELGKWWRDSCSL